MYNVLEMNQPYWIVISSLLTTVFMLKMLVSGARAAQLEKSDWLEEPLPMKAVLRSAWEAVGEQYAMTSGAPMMPGLSVDSLDSPSSLLLLELEHSLEQELEVFSWIMSGAMVLSNG